MKVLTIGIVCVGCVIGVLFVLGIYAVYLVSRYISFDNDGNEQKEHRRLYRHNHIKGSRKGKE